MPRIAAIHLVLIAALLTARTTDAAESAAGPPPPEQPTTATHSITGDFREAVRKRLTDQVERAVRERASEYQPLLENLRKRSAGEIQKLGKWEYKVVAAPTADPDELTVVLNQWAEQGWECFQVTVPAPVAPGNAAAQHLLFLRKPKGPLLERLVVGDLVKALIYLLAQRTEAESTSRPLEVEKVK